jgi:hypothetical protein
MTRYIYLVEGEDWLKQFERRRQFKLKPIHLFIAGFILATILAAAAYAASQYLGVG